MKMEYIYIYICIYVNVKKGNYILLYICLDIGCLDAWKGWDNE